MAQRVRNNVTNIRNRENVHVVTKSMVIGAPPLASKRSALGEIGNDVSTRRIVATRKAVGDGLKVHGPSQKVKEESVQVSKPVVKTKSTLKKAVSVPSIVKELTTNNFHDVEDIDRDDKGDPFLVPEYVNDIYSYLRAVEEQYPIKMNHLEGQEVTSKMRAVLIDWLVEVHQQFHLLVETLYLTVAIIDRYLQAVRTTTRKKLQLVGVGAMFVACKYEEMYAPEVSDFVYICDNAYSKEEILQMEKNIVRSLNFSFSRPLPLHFLRRYSKAAHALPMSHTMAKYFLELCLVDYEMCHYAPSLISAAAIYLALWVFHSDKRGVWTKTLAHYTTYSYKDIDLLVKKMANIVLKADVSKNQAVYKKYAKSKVLKISCSVELKSASLRKLASS